MLLLHFFMLVLFVRYTIGIFFTYFLKHTTCHFQQLWTIYCEQIKTIDKNGTFVEKKGRGVIYMPKPKKSISNEKNSMHLLEFWSRITPSILVLLGKNEPVSTKLFLNKYLVMKNCCKFRYRELLERILFRW